MSPPGGSLEVLHVDDDPAFSELAAEFIESHDDRLTVTRAESADEGLRDLAEADIECVVSDYEMPGMDGIEFLEAVRADHPELPFILFTGKGSEEVASEAISSGVTDYLQKEPGTSQYEILANRILNAIEQRRAREVADQTERRLQAIAENTNDVLWMFSGSWDEMLFVNSPYEEIWGRPVADLEADPSDFIDGIHPDDRDHVRAAMERLSAGESVDVEYRVNAAEDYGRWVWVQGEPIFDDDGEVARVVGFARDVTERKERAADRRLMEQLVRAMNDGAVIVQDGVIEYTNPNITALTGFEREELAGKPMTEFIAPEHRQTVAERHRARLAGEGDPPPDMYEIAIESTDGTQIPVEINVSEIEYGGEPATLALVRDVTERRERDRELRQLKEEYETVFETAQDAIFMIDVEADGDGDVDGNGDGDGNGEEDDYRFTFRNLNPAHEAVSGLSAEAIRGKTPREVLGPEAAAEVTERYRRCVEAGEPISYREVLEMPEGTIHWRTKLGPVVRDGEVTQIVGVARDITDRKARERELERYETMVEASGDPMYTIDEGARFTHVNDALCEKVGYDAETLVGEHVSAVMEPADIVEGTDLIRTLLSTDRTRGTFEMALITADGERIPCENHLALLPFEEEFRGTVGILRDITERRERERSLQRERDRLDGFASVVSHDLRNILSVASGHLEIVEETTDSEHAETVAEAHERMASLLDDLLYLAREGREVGELGPVDLAEIGEQCWTTVVTDGATLEVDTDRVVRADRTRLRQLLENLFRNAVQHGGEEVTVRVDDTPDGFYVEDTGPGIDEADRQDVFDAGYTTAEDGTGFGLTIVRDVVEGHDWEIDLAEGDAGGARFEISGLEEPSSRPGPEDS